jgi:hypothetical protein
VVAVADLLARVVFPNSPGCVLLMYAHILLVRGVSAGKDRYYPDHLMHSLRRRVSSRYLLIKAMPTLDLVPLVRR